MAKVSDSAKLASKADIKAARTLFEKDGDDTSVMDVEKAVGDKINALVFFGGNPVDTADYSITADTPSAGWTRFTFTFPLEGGVKVKIFA